MNGRCFVICIPIEVLLCIGSGRSDRVKPHFDITQFGSLYLGFIQSLNVRKSSNSGGVPVMKFEQHYNDIAKHSISDGLLHVQKD
jgi:hypothetical protein